MIAKIFIPTLCSMYALGVFAAIGPRDESNQRLGVVVDLENEAEIVDAQEPLPGTLNLREKRMPVVRLSLAGAYLGLLTGRQNLAERAQLAELPGVRNLMEKINAIL